jgi:hypothetical protein
VFKVVDNKAARVKVETGQRRDAKVEVTSGLKTGDVVVTAGQLKLRDGAPVTVIAAQPAKDSSAQTVPPADARGAVDVGSANAKPVKAEAQTPRRPKS